MDMDNNTNGPQEILIVNDIRDFQEVYDFPENEAQPQPIIKKEAIDNKQIYQHEHSLRPLLTDSATAETTAINTNIKLEEVKEVTISDGHFLPVDTDKTENVSKNVETNIFYELYICINPLPLSTVNACLKKGAILCDRRIGGIMQHLNDKEDPANENIRKESKQQLKEKTKVLKIECDVETSETSFLDKKPLNVEEAEIIMDNCNIEGFSIKCEEINIKSDDRFEISQFKNKRKDKLPKQLKKTSCPVPNCSFFGLNWKRHMLVHMDPEECTIYSCRLCDYKTKYKNHINIHEVVHRNPYVRSFRCRQCNMQFKTAATLKKHVKYVHFSDTSELLECFLCSAKFKNKQAITMHIKNKHRKERRTYKCSECNFATPSKRYLTLHSLKHDNLERFSCSQCPFLTYDRQCLRTHIMRNHQRERMKVHKCDKCTFETIYSQNLRLHKVHVHEKSKGMPLFKCPKCSKEFKYKSGMTAHMTLHSNAAEDILQCANCLYKTKRRTTLVRHMKLKHQQKQFKCKQCEFVTTKISVFKAHVAFHEGNVKCYVCHICQFRCKKKQGLKYHIVTCHT